MKVARWIPRSLAERQPDAPSPLDPGDIAIFYDQQNDLVASGMAAFPARDRATHEAHWVKILANETVIARTIVDGDLVICIIVSYLADGERDIGYWIGRPYWGRGHGHQPLPSASPRCTRGLYALTSPSTTCAASACLRIPQLRRPNVL